MARDGTCQAAAKRRMQPFCPRRLFLARLPGAAAVAAGHRLWIEAALAFAALVIGAVIGRASGWATGRNADLAAGFAPVSGWRGNGLRIAALQTARMARSGASSRPAISTMPTPATPLRRFGR